MRQADIGYLAEEEDSASEVIGLHNLAEEGFHRFDPSGGI
jgi:hypothetical protein